MDYIYTISNHAKQRYSERIMGKEDNNDVQRFMITNEDKIVSDINKMIEYGTLIFQGKQYTKNGNGNNVKVYRNGLWIILVDDKTNNVITLYKIDLGIDDDFNSLYVDKMISKIEEETEKKDRIYHNCISENERYKSIIEDNEAMINEYKGYIKNLEELNSGYKNILEDNNVYIDMANQRIAEVVNKLIGKHEF